MRKKAGKQNTARQFSNEESLYFAKVKNPENIGNTLKNDLHQNSFEKIRKLKNSNQQRITS